LTLFVEFLVALIVALLVAVLLIGALDWEYPGRGGGAIALFLFFMMLLLFIWASGGWLTPFGPVVYGVYWLPFLMVGIFILMLLAASGPRRPSQMPTDSASFKGQGKTSRETLLAAIFWLLILFLLAALIIRYTYII